MGLDYFAKASAGQITASLTSAAQRARFLLTLWPPQSGVQIFWEDKLGDYFSQFEAFRFYAIWFCC